MVSTDSGKSTGRVGVGDRDTVEMLGGGGDMRGQTRSPTKITDSKGSPDGCKAGNVGQELKQRRTEYTDRLRKATSRGGRARTVSKQQKEESKTSSNNTFVHTTRDTQEGGNRAGRVLPGR